MAQGEVFFDAALAQALAAGRASAAGALVPVAQVTGAAADVAEAADVEEAVPAPAVAAATAAASATAAAAAAAGAGGLPLLLGLQEWPEQGSREAALLDACNARGLRTLVAAVGDVALAVSAAAFGRPLDLTAPGGWAGALASGALPAQLAAAVAAATAEELLEDAEAAPAAPPAKEDGGGGAERPGGSAACGCDPEALFDAALNSSLDEGRFAGMDPVVSPPEVGSQNGGGGVSGSSGVAASPLGRLPPVAICSWQPVTASDSQ